MIKYRFNSRQKHVVHLLICLPMPLSSLLDDILNEPYSCGFPLCYSILALLAPDYIWHTYNVIAKNLRKWIQGGNLHVVIMKIEIKNQIIPTVKMMLPYSCSGFLYLW